MKIVGTGTSLARESVCGWRLTRRFNIPLCFWRRHQHRHRQGSLDGTVNSAGACTGHVAYIACAVVWYDWCPSHAAMTQPCPALDAVNYTAIDVSTLCLRSVNKYRIRPTVIRTLHVTSIYKELLHCITLQANPFKEYSNIT